MVTIEQKLALFSKLLNQGVEEEVEQKKEALDKEYERLMATDKFNIDKEANKIIEEARRKAEVKKIELVSKGRISSKKESMYIREKCIARFMERLINRVEAFIKTSAYETYLIKKIKEIERLKISNEGIEIYLTPYDYTNRQNMIRETFRSAGFDMEKVALKQGDSNLLGGFVIKDQLMNARIDESILALLEESHDYIMAQVTGVLGEVGELLDK